MRLSLFLTLALMGICLASNGWTLQGCGQHNEEEMRNSLKDAINIAETAVKVLDTSLNDDKVQSMVKYILGDDAWFSQKLDRAKWYLQNVAQIVKDEQKDIVKLGPFADETDVIIYCDQSNYEWKGNMLIDKVISKPVVGFHEKKAFDKCFDPLLEDEGPVAMTSQSSSTKYEYKKIYKAWVAGGRQDILPLIQPWTVPQRDKPCTMNLCTWYLDALGKLTFIRIDDDTIKSIEAKNFAPEDGNTDEPIDALLNTLTGTLLHELTHTIRGGIAMDDEEDGFSYGWDDIGRLHNPDNSDSINALGVCMYLFSKGYWVDDDGNVQKLPEPEKEKEGEGEEEEEEVRNP